MPGGAVSGETLVGNKWIFFLSTYCSINGGLVIAVLFSK